MSVTTGKALRIGELSELTGTTPRTIRYYEEIGLLSGAGDRVQGQHRCYSEADVARVREIVRLRDLLGVSLEQLSTLLEAQAARAELRQEYREAEDSLTRRRILEDALGHITTQLELVRERHSELEALEAELLEKRDSVRRRLADPET
ncbi:MAG: MerR family transcriptional regulator [Solirubrobacteraceae bacterium]